MNNHEEQRKALVAALVAQGEAVLDLVWAMRWLDSLTDDLNAERWQRNGDTEHPRSREFLDDLAARRAEKPNIDNAAKEAGL